MESYQTPSSTPETHLFDLHLDQTSKSYLGETARWAKFLSIVGFIFCGFIVLLGIFFGTIMAKFSGMGGGDAAYETSLALGKGFAAFIYILIAVVYFFPCLYLFNFATKMQVALKNDDQTNLNTSLHSLKRCYKFVGILTIVMLSFYALALIVVMIAGGMAAMMH